MKDKEIELEDSLLALNEYAAEELIAFLELPFVASDLDTTKDDDDNNIR
jgi:hypothetical protein